jgi:glycosyltransferase involved in cell wall biosynthesis
MISVIIPSRNEIFLKKTILDVLANATGDIEIFPVLDGYEPPAEEIVEDPRVTYLRIPLGDGDSHKRHAINRAVDICKGEYIMALDAHCMMAKGFDEQLIKDHQPDWIQVPRRNRLDAEHWSLQLQSDNRPPIDYEYVLFPFYHDAVTHSPREPKKDSHRTLHDFKWDSRTLARMDVPIDEVMTIQGSCFFMAKKYFKDMGFMQIEGFTGWGQDGEEVGLKTWLAGGKVMVNKNTWYAHLHKGKHYGRMYFVSTAAIKNCEDYWYDFFVHNRWHKRIHDFEWLIEKFWPVPNWPENWKELLYPK